MTIDSELDRLAKTFRRRLAAINIESLSEAFAEAQARYEIACEGISPGGGSPATAELGQRVSRARSAIASAKGDQRQLGRQLAVCERLLAAADRKRAASAEVAQAIQRAAASRSAHAEALSTVARLRERFDKQSAMDAVTARKETKELARQMGEDVAAFAGDLAKLGPVSRQASILATAIARASESVEALDRDARVADEQVRDARRCEDAAQLDVLELAHANALQAYVGVLAPFRAAFRSIYGRNPEAWDYAALADGEEGDERVLRVVGAV